MLIMGINRFFFFRAIFNFYFFYFLHFAFCCTPGSSLPHFLFSTLCIFPHSSFSTLHTPQSSYSSQPRNYREDSSILLSKMKKLNVWCCLSLRFTLNNKESEWWSAVTNRDREALSCKSFDIRYIFVIKIPRNLGGHTACHTFRDWSILTVW